MRRLSNLWLGGLTGLALLAWTDAVAAAAPADIRIDGVNVYPESVSSTSDGTVYVGSMKGVVFRASPGATTAEPWLLPTAENGLLSLFGVLADERSNTLWLCSSPGALRKPPAVGTAALMAFDLKTGSRKAAYPFPPPDSICNDITVAPDGTAYATDTPNGRIFVLKPGASSLALFAADDRLKGIEGVVTGGDGALYADVIRAGQVYRLERAADGAFKALTQLALSRPLAGPDGFRLIGGSRFLLVEGAAGKLDLVTIEGDRATVETLRSGLAQPTAATATRGIAYVTEGRIGYLVDPKLRGREPGPFSVRAASLPPAP